MRAAVLKHATTLTTALFAIIGITGVLLFYRLQSPVIKPMHEWLGLALVAAAGLHIWRNWLPLKGYFSRGALYAPIALALLVAGGFIFVAIRTPAAPDAGKQIMRAFVRAPLAQAASLLRGDADAIVAHLREQGFRVESSAQSLAQIGEASGRPERDALAAVMETLKKR